MRAILVSICIGAGCLVVVPAIVLIAVSLNGTGALQIPTPAQIDAKWYAALIHDRAIVAAISLSVWVALCVAILDALLALAVIFATTAQKLARWLLGAMVVVAVVPGLLHGLSVDSLLGRIGLGHSPAWVILAEATWTFPFGAILGFAQARGIPPRVIEAGREMGASDGQLFWYLIVPACRSSLVSAAAIGFLLTLNEHIRVFYLGAEPMLGTYVYGKMRGGADPSVAAIGATFFLLGGALIALLHSRLAELIFRDRGHE